MTYRVPFVAYRRQYEMLKPELDEAIARTLGEGNLILREDVRQFESRMAAFIGVGHGVGVNSCSDGLIFALKGLGVGPGDEVITVAHTFLATIEAIVHAGATPVLVDVGDDYLMDMSLLESAITTRTRAIIPVHLNGRVCDMVQLMAIARKHKLFVVEDAAQALGATLDGRMAGSFGEASCYSFYPAKLLGAAGDGGMVCTDDPALTHRLRLFRDHGREGKDQHVLYGFTSRLDNLQAAILNAKWPRLKEWIDRRRQLAAIYDERLRAVEGIRIPPGSDARHCDVYQNYVCRAERRDDLATYVRNQGIEVLISNPVPVHKHPALRLDRFDLPMTTRLAEEVISLPLVPELTDDEVRLAAETVAQFYTEGRA